MPRVTNLITTKEPKIMHTKHTTGPWDVSPESAIGEGEGCDCYSLNAGNPHHSPNHKEQYANAALMAAAPDLLALAYDFGQMLTGMDPYTVDDVAIMRNKIKAAIARATGAAQ